MKPGKHQSSKQRGQDGGWKVHDRAHLLFITHTVCMNNVITMFLMVRPCLYEGELSLVRVLPSIPSRLLPRVYTKRVVPAYRVKVDLA